jgi:hypothetical protein
MPNLNQKLISVLGRTMASALVIFSAHCGSLVKELKCIDERYKGVDDKTDDLETNCAKPVAAKIFSSSPTNGAVNVSAASYRVLIDIENSNKSVLDASGFTVSLNIDNNAAVFFPNSTLSVIPNPNRGKNGGYYVQFNIDNTIFNQTNPNSSFNLPYGSVMRITINNGDFSEMISFTVEENPTGLPNIDNDYSIVEVISPTQIRLRNVINNYAVKYINLTGVLPGVDYVYSHIEDNKLFIMRDTGINSRAAVGDAISNGHNVIEIDLLTGNFVNTVVPSQNIPVFNTMENLISAHQGPTTTATTVSPPGDWRIYPIIRRKNIVNGAGAELVLRMGYNGGETQELVVSGVMNVFDGATPALSLRLSNNKYVVIPEPGVMLVLTFDYNAAAAFGNKVSVAQSNLTLPLTLPNPAAGEYFWGISIIEDKNTPGQFFTLYNDINLNRHVQKLNTSSPLLGRVPVPNTGTRIFSYTSQPIENALGIYQTGTNQVQVYSGQNFSTSTLGALVYSYAGSTQLAVVPPILNVGNESAAQTLDAATKIYNKSQAGFSTVNLTTQFIEKRSSNNTLLSSVDISGLISLLKSNLGIVSPLVMPNDAKVIEQAGNYILVLKINDGTRERVAVLDLQASAPAWISPAGSDCEMVYGAGKFNNGTDRLLVLYHLVGAPSDFTITDGVTTYTSPATGITANSMIILDPDFTNGSPTQMKVAVAKSNGVQILTFNKANLAAPASNATILNNLVAALGADVNLGSFQSLQASTDSDNDGASPNFYSLGQVLKGGVLKQMLPTTTTTGVISGVPLEWDSTLKLIQGFKRLTDGRWTIVDTLGRVYVMDASGNTQRTFHANMRMSNLFH